MEPTCFTSKAESGSITRGAAAITIIIEWLRVTAWAGRGPWSNGSGPYRRFRATGETGAVSVRQVGRTRRFRRHSEVSRFKEEQFEVVTHLT